MALRLVNAPLGAQARAAAGEIRVKICGLRSLADMDAAVQAGAAFGGLVFYARSPRHLTLPEARALALAAPVGLAKVALLVDSDDALLDAVLAEVPVDMVQLHGSEPPERVAAIRARHGLPVIKAVGLASSTDLAAITAQEAVSDMILVDAKPVQGGALPGGNGLSFDWRLLEGRLWRKPWMLAGGLTPENVAAAIACTGARQVDVSSGVESHPGRKDPARIAAFCAAAHGAGG